MSRQNFKLLSPLTQVEKIAEGSGVHERAKLNREFGKGHWRKLKGVARVLLGDGTIQTAEIHYYEAHGIGKRKLKIKRLLD